MTGNKKIDQILVAMSSLATLLTALVFIYTVYIYEKPLPNETQHMLDLIQSARQQAFAEAYKLEGMTINLPSSTSRLRFLDLEIHLVPFFPNQHSLIDRNIPIITDIIIDIAGHMEPSELNTTIGRILLENRVKEAINSQLGQKVIKEILFTRFVIQ